MFRPVVYVYCMMKYDRKSYTPVKATLVMDFISIIGSLYRL
jgi:mannose/fructose/N-acetylgalactosamine-specific phosphotransferase system component IID